MLPALRVATLTVLSAACTTLPDRDPLDLRDGTTRAGDGVSIHFLEGGRGEPALVFVHGWLGVAAWWEPTMHAFAGEHRVVALDLAGHGQSGAGRTDWTVEAFAGDVEAVVRTLDLQHVVLLGHSMSGAITVEAARRLGSRVDLLVPVDTLNDVDWDLPPEVWDQFFGGLRADFPSAVAAFFRQMLFRPDSPPEVVERVVALAQSAPPERSVAMLESARDFDLKAALRAFGTPIHAIQSDANPTELARNRAVHPRWQAEILTGVGHWPMLEAPERFQAALRHVLATGH